MVEGIKVRLKTRVFTTSCDEYPEGTEFTIARYNVPLDLLYLNYEGKLALGISPDKVEVIP